MVLQYSFYVEKVLSIKLEMTTTHLLFEEMLSGDRDQDSKVLKDKIDKVEKDLKTISACSIYEKHTKVFQKLLSELGQFESHLYFSHTKSEKTSDSQLHHEMFHTFFYQFIKDLGDIEQDLTNKIDVELTKYRELHFVMLGLSVVVVIFISVIFHYYRRKRKVEKAFYRKRAKHARMGEMIENITHQWRQPLNALNLVVQKVEWLHSLNRLDADKLLSSMQKSKKLIDSMTNTIEDFRNFFNPHRDKHNFLIQDAIDQVHLITEPIFLEGRIEYRYDIEDQSFILNGYQNELSQVILNLQKNAYDALIEKGITAPMIQMKVRKEKDNIVIEVQDNAGGVPQELLSKIFKPYYSTKETGKGTGIGLYMSKVMIEKHMDGQLSCFNTEEGACFRIML